MYDFKITIFTTNYHYIINGSRGGWVVKKNSGMIQIENIEFGGEGPNEVNYDLCIYIYFFILS